MMWGGVWLCKVTQDKVIQDKARKKILIEWIIIQLEKIKKLKDSEKK